MNVLIVCRDARAEALAQVFAGHDVYLLESDAPRPIWSRWQPRLCRWRPVLGTVPGTFDLALVHEGDRSMAEQANGTMWRVALYFSGSGHPDSTRDNECAFREWRSRGGHLELRLVPAVSMASREAVLSAMDISMLATVAAEDAEALPPCCSPRADRREQIAALDLLVQAWLLCSSDEGPWPRLRRQLVGSERLEELRLEVAKRLLTHGQQLLSAENLVGVRALFEGLYELVAEEVKASDAATEFAMKLRESLGRYLEREALS